MLKKKKSLNLNTLNSCEETINLRKERKAILMVVINGIVNFILRLSELANLVCNVMDNYAKHSKDFSSFCTLNSFCTNIISIADVFFIIPFTINFFIFYVFNSNFRHAFRKLLSKTEYSRVVPKSNINSR
jgi:hypothetical protein